MVDRLTPERRSHLMAQVRSRNTTPELAVRRLAYSLGYRFRLHRRDLPGCPDLVFPSRNAVVFVHGCFWHRHKGCSKSSMPSTHVEFWTAKFSQTIQRDKRVSEQLERQGWRVLVIWQCEIRDRETLTRRLQSFLDQAVARA
jgi:DNA mismatch endonuclease (patch repair protein)